MLPFRTNLLHSLYLDSTRFMDIPCGSLTLSSQLAGSVMKKIPNAVPNNHTDCNAVNFSGSPTVNLCPIAINGGITGFKGPNSFAMHAPKWGACTDCGGS